MQLQEAHLQQEKKKPDMLIIKYNDKILQGYWTQIPRSPMFKVLWRR